LTVTLSTIKELFDAYFEHKVAIVDPRSAKNYRSTQQKFEDFIGSERKIDTIEESDVLLFIEQHQENANSTIANYLKRCSQAFRFAIKKKWLTENPFADLDERKKYSCLIAENKTSAQEQLVTSEMIQQLLDCPKSLRSEEESADWDVLVSILRWSGCRIAEALILRWDDVRFDDDELLIRGKRTGRKRHRSGERTNRFCPLWPELRVDLENHQQFQESSGQNSEYILNAIGSLAGCQGALKTCQGWAR